MAVSRKSNIPVKTIELGVQLFIRTMKFRNEQFIRSKLLTAALQWPHPLSYGMRLRLRFAAVRCSSAVDTTDATATAAAHSVFFVVGHHSSFAMTVFVVVVV